MHGPPDLVIEIGSESMRRRDETIKRRLYERFDVPEYWVVDPDAEAITVYRPQGEQYECAAELTRQSGGVLTTRIFPGLEMPLSQIFPR